MALSDNLVVYYALDEASGNATDSLGANDLTDNNTVGSDTGIQSNCRSFASASSEYFSRADNATLSMGDIDMSIAGWVYLASKPADEMAWACKGSGGGGEYDLDWLNSSDRFRFRVWGASGFGSAGSVSATTFGAPATSTWYFLVARHAATANTISICVNDGTVDSAAHSAGIFDGGNVFSLGSFGGVADFANGRIDELGIWKRLLTSAEITELYNGGSGRDYAYITGGSPPAATGYLNLPLLGVG